MQQQVYVVSFGFWAQTAEKIHQAAKLSDLLVFQTDNGV